MLQMGRPTPLEGVQSTAPILEQAFGLADDLIAAGTIETAPEKDRLFAVELPGDYKLAIVRLDTFRPLTRKAFETQVANPGTLLMASREGWQATEDPMSLKALMRYTQFKWAEGYSDKTLGENEDSADADDEEASE